MFAFELGREFKLSIAEIFAIFSQRGNIIFCDKKILILDGISKDEILSKAKKIGGTIKIMEVLETGEDIENTLHENINIENHQGKYNYAMNIFGNPSLNSHLIRGGIGGGLKEILKISKKVIKEYGKNPRFINGEFKNISSVAIIKEALVKKQTDFNFIFTQDKIYFGKTIFVQDIYGYSNRDYGKDRDMHVGMLPPKLAQMMINIATPPALLPIDGARQRDSIIYDPFVGLGTVLIESVYMGNKKIFGSDVSQKMVETTNKNLEKLKDKFSFEKKIIFQNAKYIHEIDFLTELDAIVTEGYLGEIMTKNNISTERIEKQRKKLKDIYEGFFSGLKKLNFSGNIVICFPFWEMKGKYFYFEEIYDIISKYCKIEKLLPKNLEFIETKSGSLLYKRNSQLVGREIFYLKLK